MNAQKKAPTRETPGPGQPQGDGGSPERDPIQSADDRHAQVELAAERLRLTVPRQLQQMSAWVCWVREAKPGKPGKFNKFPHYAASGRRRSGTQASPEDRAQLVTMERALAAWLAKPEEYYGVGITTLPGNGVMAVDLDDAKDERGEWKSLAKELLQVETYAETSPSGRGIRMFFLGETPNHRNHDCGDGVGIELFSSKGFVTVTGNVINGNDSLLVLDSAMKQRLIELAGSKERQHAGEDTSRIPARISEMRNVTLTKMGGYLRRGGLGASEIFASLLAVNDERCSPPLPRDEVRTIAESVARYKSGEIEWDEPTDLLGGFQTPALTPEDVPPIIGRYAGLLGSEVGWDPTITISAGVASAAAMLDDRIRLKLPGSSEHFQSARLWTAVIGGPGCGKTPGQEKMFAPVRHQHKKLLVEYKVMVDEQAGNNKKSAEDRIPLELLYTTDATVEGLARALADNPRGITYVTEELESWLGSFGRYSQKGMASSDRGYAIALYDGGDQQIIRGDERKMRFVENWGASVLSATTESVLHKLAPILPADGLVQRMMLFQVRPMRDGDPVDPADMDHARKMYDARLRKMYTHGDEDHGGDVVRMSGEAEAAYATEVKRLRGLAESVRTINEPLAFHIAKHSGMLARVALTFHAVSLDAHPGLEELSVETMALAKRYMRKVLRHAWTVYGELLRGATSNSLVQPIARSILASELVEFNATDLTKKCKPYGGTPAREQEAALRALTDHGWIRSLQPRDPYGHGARWEVNPRAHELFAEEGERHRQRRREVREGILTLREGDAD